jgi:hypothetical protein
MHSFDIFRATLAITSNIAYCLPRHIVPEQVRQMASMRPYSREHILAPRPAVVAGVNAAAVDAAEEEMSSEPPSIGIAASAAIAASELADAAAGVYHPVLPCELEENCLNGKVKMMTAYFGELVQQAAEEEVAEPYASSLAE